MTTLLPEYKEELEKVFLDPKAVVMPWKVPFKPGVETVRYYPSADYMRSVVSELTDFAKARTPKASVSVCYALCGHDMLDPKINVGAHEKGISCTGARIPKPVAATAYKFLNAYKV